MAEEGNDLLSGLIIIQPLLEDTQFMEPVRAIITRFPTPFNKLFGAFKQLASNCAQDTIQAGPDVGRSLEEAIGAYTSN